MEGDLFVLERMHAQLLTMQDVGGLIYTAAFDTDAWVVAGEHTIYWPAHLMHDRP